jgi:hypothetical protein
MDKQRNLIAEFLAFTDFASKGDFEHAPNLAQRILEVQLSNPSIVTLSPENAVFVEDLREFLVYQKLISEQKTVADAWEWLKGENTLLHLDLFDETFERAIDLFANLSLSSGKNGEVRDTVVNLLKEKRKEIVEGLAVPEPMSYYSDLSRRNVRFMQLLEDLAYAIKQKHDTTPSMELPGWINYPEREGGALRLIKERGSLVNKNE